VTTVEHTAELYT